MIQNQELSIQTLGLLGIVKFLWIMLFGTFIGLVCGFIGAFLVKTTKHYSNLQPFLVYGMCFFAYTSCNLLSISSIFGVISCSFFIRPFADHNMTTSNKAGCRSFQFFTRKTESLDLILEPEIDKYGYNGEISCSHCRNDGFCPAWSCYYQCLSPA